MKVLSSKYVYVTFLLIQLIGAQSLFELNWIQAQPLKVKLIIYARDL